MSRALMWVAFIVMMFVLIAPTWEVVSMAVAAGCLFALAGVATNGRRI